MPGHAMSNDRFRTITGRAEGTLREKASKFIGIAFPIVDETEFKKALALIANEHHAARHLCFAYVLGEDGSIQRSSDAGEPSGTAGLPILRAIMGADLTFTAVVVVRYFGGTLLGKGGLVQAYGDTARAALANAQVIIHVVKVRVSFRSSIPGFDQIKRELPAVEGEVLEKHFDAECTGIISVARDHVDDFLDRLRSINIRAERMGQLK